MPCYSGWEVRYTKGTEGIEQALYIIAFSIYAGFTILAIAYAFNIIYLIGDPRQLVPLLEGLIPGAFIFSIAGYYLMNKSTLFSFSIALFGVILAFLIIYDLHMVLDYAFLGMVSFLVTSPLALISRYLSGRSLTRRGRGISMPIIVSTLFLLEVVAVAVLYEKSGQTNLAVQLSVLAYVSIALAALIFITNLIGTHAHDIKEINR
ncbi:hypothetical protein DMB44_08925 [Thermoplasma sp. Kam2015]|uniref:hypothetical protein n=1 Tax=Thermoplasma sp. Kam2015 TaxID=2094122 RepID=UPI000D896FAB|nr:hypothetical protein [Thermoplasma sp. Kam2015]PYB67530.1 hypothetical protein DMB44_08925 [Thermoplasma sp. Kam2015]